MQILKSPPNNKDYDIIKEREFGSSNEAFKAAMRELKEEGKGDTKHHPEIADADLKLMYSHFTDCRPMSPIQLQEKVQFDVRFYFFRRGAENTHKMNKNTFMLVTNPETNQRYLRLAGDELTKNHQNTKESHTAAMPEMPNDARCPVSSYLKYLSHLHPECESLWTRPLPTTVNSPENINNKSWYSKAPIGKSTLGRFMKDLSSKYMLSQSYTNHSIRVTGATILTRENFAASQIKAVTGHRSVTSLSIYQRVSDVDKSKWAKLLEGELGQHLHHQHVRNHRFLMTVPSLCLLHRDRHWSPYLPKNCWRYVTTCLKMRKTIHLPVQHRHHQSRPRAYSQLISI